tara:strand:+ start:265 stop:441 length:177 start_codon:yes stop_codon:yes gene_type:complete
LNSSGNDNQLAASSPLQRKTTLKWGSDGELSSIDMARILEKLEDPHLRECDLSCDIEK